VHVREVEKAGGTIVTKRTNHALVQEVAGTIRRCEFLLCWRMHVTYPNGTVLSLL
jgi:hypothetical protein